MSLAAWWVLHAVMLAAIVYSALDTVDIHTKEG